jgi:hypothetical protein
MLFFFFALHPAENKVQKVGKTIEFKTEAHAHADEQASKVSLRDASKLTVSTGKGLSSDYGEILLACLTL